MSSSFRVSSSVHISHAAAASLSHPLSTIQSTNFHHVLRTVYCHNHSWGHSHLHLIESVSYLVCLGKREKKREKKKREKKGKKVREKKRRERKKSVRKKKREEKKTKKSAQTFSEESWRQSCWYILLGCCFTSLSLLPLWSSLISCCPELLSVLHWC